MCAEIKMRIKNWLLLLRLKKKERIKPGLSSTDSTMKSGKKIIQFDLCNGYEDFYNLRFQIWNWILRSSQIRFL